MGNCMNQDPKSHPRTKEKDKKGATKDRAKVANTSRATGKSGTKRTPNSGLSVPETNRSVSASSAVSGPKSIPTLISSKNDRISEQKRLLAEQIRQQKEQLERIQNGSFAKPPHRRSRSSETWRESVKA